MSYTKKIAIKSEILKTLKEKEENVLRMRRGLIADLEMELELKAKNNPELQQAIARIEKGIMDDIRELIEKYEGPSSNTTKAKIITSLKKKGK